MTVHAFGMEENGAQARWGPGIRNRVIIHFVIRGKGYLMNRRPAPTRDL